MTLAAVVQTANPGVHRAHTSLPLWRETLWPIDWFSLRISAVYYGRGVPAGDGGPVVVVPGFLASDALMYELYGWLERIGYRPYFSGIGMNVDCPRATAEKLGRTVERAYVDTGRRVRIVGHSLGGMIGRRVALQMSQCVQQLIYLGTPIQRVHTHPAMIAAANFLATARGLLARDQCFNSGCACDFLEDANRPLPADIRHDAIYTRDDGVVDWHDSAETEERRNHEVGGTHIGLVYNPRAYKALGHILQNRRQG
jgi:pimeloyl-ACP methyl ester carboxylesterase